MYIILNSNGKWVARPGQHSAFTTNPLYAQKFKTLEEAQKNCCGNERPVNFERIIDTYRQ